MGTLTAARVASCEAENRCALGCSCFGNSSRDDGACDRSNWYRENITNGAELWTAWLRGPSLLALANLADEFGGLCSTDWIRYPLDPERFPPAGSNPFRDGGC